MTHSTVAEAPWQIEVDRGRGRPADYYSIAGVKLAGENMVLVLANGETVHLKNAHIRKILIMRTSKDPSDE